jgi:hypothetical protein
MAGRPGLYVAYTASRENGERVDGYMIIRNRVMPTTQQMVESTIDEIARIEGMAHVIPVYFLELAETR